MQKILMVFITCMILMTGCNGKVDIKFEDDSKHNNMNCATYRFIGESKHFYFKTGKVYYNNKYKALLISNFNIKDNIDSNITFSINLYFNDNLLYGDIYNSNNIGEFTKESINNIVIAESGEVGEKDKNGNIIGESDSFLETEKDTFKDSIKLEAKYCEKSKCKIEQFKITYID